MGHGTVGPLPRSLYVESSRLCHVSTWSRKHRHCSLEYVKAYKAASCATTPTLPKSLGPTTQMAPTPEETILEILRDAEGNLYCLAVEGSVRLHHRLC